MNSLKTTPSAYRQYHAISRHWASDIEFFKFEMVFLHHVLDDYFMQLSGPEYLERLKSAGKKLLQLEQENYSAKIRLTEHLKTLEGQTEDLIFEQGDLISTKHDQMEHAIINLTATYRSIKTELFTLIQALIKASKN